MFLYGCAVKSNEPFTVPDTAVTTFGGTHPLVIYGETRSTLSLNDSMTVHADSKKGILFICDSTYKIPTE